MDLQVAILLVDCQGTSDNRRSDVKLDTLIMYISLQLSSVQILNVVRYLRSDELTALKVSNTKNSVFQVVLPLTS